MVVLAVQFEFGRWLDPASARRVQAALLAGGTLPYRMAALQFFYS